MGPYTGDVAQYGLAVRSGILLYLKEFNKNGGAGGRQIVPIAEDEKGDSTEAILVYNKLLDENVCAILGDVPQRQPLHWRRNRFWTTFLA